MLARGGSGSDAKSLPDLRKIQEPDHPGLTAGVCEAYAEAAEVCLARHHHPPSTLIGIDCCGKHEEKLLAWNQPSAGSERAWNNRDDATRDAAYIVSIAVLESELGLVALARAETRTGADYYVGTPNSIDLESAYRLEVSGTDTGDKKEVRRRLRQKVRQALEGDSDMPAYASVVGFREAAVVLAEVQE